MYKLNLKTKAFSLKNTLECGQLFRISEHGDHYYIMVNDTLLKIRQDKNHLYYDTKPRVEDKFKEAFIHAYFRFDDNLGMILRNINKDKIMAKAVRKYRGLRLVRYEPFECLISYICSANNSIPNVRAMTELMSFKYGDRVVLDGFESYTFPTPEKLANASIGELRKCKVGFRAKGIMDAAKKVERGFIDFDELRKMRYKEARRKLMRIRGVGDKVADCVCLFSLDKLEAFPVDTWVHKLFTEQYFKKKKVSKDDIREFGQQYFGKYAGYAQEYLFYYARSL